MAVEVPDEPGRWEVHVRWSLGVGGAMTAVADDASNQVTILEQELAAFLNDDIAVGYILDRVHGYDPAQARRRAQLSSASMSPRRRFLGSWPRRHPAVVGLGGVAGVTAILMTLGAAFPGSAEPVGAVLSLLALATFMAGLLRDVNVSEALRPEGLFFGTFRPQTWPGLRAGVPFYVAASIFTLAAYGVLT